MTHKYGYTNVYRLKKEGGKTVQRGFIYIRGLWMTNVLWFAVGVFTSFLLRAMMLAGF